MGPSRHNSIRSAAALVAAVAAQQQQLNAAAAEARDRQLQTQAQAAAEQEGRLPAAQLQPNSAARQRTQGSMSSPAVSSPDGVHIHLHTGGEKPTLNPDGQSGSQGTNGSQAVRKASATERLAAERVMDPSAGAKRTAPEAIQRGLTRVGHKFNVEIRPDGTVVHRYGSDVPADLRTVVLQNAKRHLSANGGMQAR